MYLKIGKRVLVLVTMFTLGHTLSLVLAAYNVVTINGALVEFLIPITILIGAVYNVFTGGKNDSNNKIGLLFFMALFFGLIHGLGFAREFAMVFGDADNKILALIEFALGIEMAQIINCLRRFILGIFMSDYFQVFKTRLGYGSVIHSHWFGNSYSY